MRIVHTCLLLVAFVQVANGAQAPERVAVTEAAAKANAASRAGKTYGEDLGRAFGKEHSATVGARAKTLRRPDLSSVVLFIQAERDGRIGSVLPRPETNLSTCVRDRVKAWRVPVPPDAAYWSKVDVVLQPR